MEKFFRAKILKAIMIFHLPWLLNKHDQWPDSCIKQAKPELSLMYLIVRFLKIHNLILGVDLKNVTDIFCMQICSSPTKEPTIVGGAAVDH